MNKDCVRRGDIWMANLISGKGDVLQGSHPVIIVSNNRNNRRSGVVTVVPMTSSVKPPMSFHVEVSGYGLRKKSISVVIPVYNQKRQLQLTLDFFSRQIVDESFELIVVDDCSDEPCDTVVDNFKDKMDVIYIKNAINRGRSYSRNVGIEKNTGEIIVFCDADRYPCADFLQRHLDFHRKKLVPKIVCIGGVYENISKSPYDLSKKQIIRPATYYSTIRNLFDADGECMSAVPWISTLSGNMSISKTTAQKFDEDFQGWGFEHFEFGYRLFKSGYQFVLNDMAKNYHIAHKRGTNQYRDSMINSLEVFLRKHPDYEIFQFGKFIFGDISLQEFEYLVSGVVRWKNEVSKPIYNHIISF